ncbi:MAG: SDR family NAD(P)-dependent oxidoreductase [Opitutus sp.]
MSSLTTHYAHAFVSGASKGLGRAFTEMLLDENVRVWGTARDAAALTDLATRYPTTFTPVVMDLQAPAAAEAAFTRAANSVGGAFDLLINNAGYGVFGGFDEAEFELWQKQLDAMLGTTLRLTHVALRGMRRRNRGCIVNVSSLAAEFPLPFMSGYNVVKAGLSALSESLIIETRDTDLKVIDFRPGDFRTDFNDAMLTTSSSAQPAPTAVSAAWRGLEAHRHASPKPMAAARDLRRALLRRKSGIVRSGSFFQARFAPTFTAVIPASLRRWITARYFGL